MASQTTKPGPRHCSKATSPPNPWPPRIVSGSGVCRASWCRMSSLSSCRMQWVGIPVACDIPRPGWHFMVVKSNPGIALHTGNANVGTCNYSLRPEDPIRPDPSSKWHTGKAALFARGEFQNESLCFGLQPPPPVYGPGNVVNQHSRPTNKPNMWASESTDFAQPEWIESRTCLRNAGLRINIIKPTLLFPPTQRYNIL